MSLMRSLTKVAAGVMLAKGIGTMMSQQQQGRKHGKVQGGGLLDNLIRPALVPAKFAKVEHLLAALAEVGKARLEEGPSAVHVFGDIGTLRHASASSSQGPADRDV